MTEPVTDSVPFSLILPLRFMDPVFCALVTIASSTVADNAPETAKNILPSLVFNANSPNCKLELVGFCPDTALLRSLTICAICMESLKNLCGIYHGLITYVGHYINIIIIVSYLNKNRKF